MADRLAVAVSVLGDFTEQMTGLRGTPEAGERLHALIAGLSPEDQSAITRTLSDPDAQAAMGCLLLQEVMAAQDAEQETADA